MKRVICLLGSVSLLLALGACGSVSYADGVYTAQSEPYEAIDESDADQGGNGYGVATLTIQGGKIVEAQFSTYELDGTLKDEDYGKQNGEIANQDYYNKAQRAVKASQNYADQLTAKGDPDAVDAISGATISYNEFQEAVKLALKQAKE